MAIIREGNQEQALKIGTIINRNFLMKGLLYFTLLTVSGLTIVHFYTWTPETLETLDHLDVQFFLITIALSFVDMFLGAYRNHIFIRKVKKNVSPWLSFRANLANVFLGAVTPSQTGGSLAQLFIFYRGGVPLSNSIPISMINFICTMVFFLSSAGIAFYATEHLFSTNLLSHLIRFGVVFIISILILYLLILWKPALLGRVVRNFARLVSYVHQRWSRIVLDLSEKLLREVDKFRETFKYFLHRKPRLMLYSFGMTILLYLNKFTIGYFLLCGLGIEVDYLEVVIAQMIILIILYFSPSPGGSGIAELSIAGVMSGLIPSYVLAIYTPLHRFFLLYLPVLLGAGVFLREFKKQG
jgi:uncharacterized protein (TIRG00374 family)